MSARAKTREEALTASYLFQKDIERALGISKDHAKAIFRKAKQIDHEGGFDFSPRKVRRLAVEQASGIRFDRILRTEKEKAEKGGL